MEEARERLVHDAVVTVEATSMGYMNHVDVVGQRRAVMVRALIERLRTDAYAAPISDDELARHTALRWLDMDRPEARITVHAVVIPADKEDASEWTKASHVAGKIADAVRGEADAGRFKDLAKAVDGEGMQVIVQDLAPVTDDGRVADLVNRPPWGHPTPTFDESFVRGVFALAAVGDQSPLVRSAFGVHVVLLVAIQDALWRDTETRRSMLADEIRAHRMREVLDGLLMTLRSKTPTKVDRSVEEMLKLLSVGRPEAAGWGQ